MKKRSISATQFKAQCLALLDECEKRGTELVITKRGKPVARLVPLEPVSRRKPLGGRILGDIVGPIEVEWTPRPRKLEARFIGDVISPVEGEWIE